MGKEKGRAPKRSTFVKTGTTFHRNAVKTAGIGFAISCGRQFIQVSVFLRREFQGLLSLLQRHRDYGWSRT